MTSKSQSPYSPQHQADSSSDDDHLSPHAMPLAAPSSSSSPNPSQSPPNLDLTSAQAQPTKRASRVNFNDDHAPSRNASPRQSVFESTATILKRNVPSNNPETIGEGAVDERTAILGVERGNERWTTYNTDGPGPAATGGERYNRRKPARSSLGGQIDGTVEEEQGEHNEEHTAHTTPALVGWWRMFLDKYGSVELENKGSVARDHLALERTFLAWLRTSLSFASIGIAVTQLFRLNVSINQDQPTGSQLRLRHIGRPLGATFLAVGIITLVIGFRRYFESQHYVIQGKFPASRGSVIVIAFCSGALIVASFAVILAIGNVTKDSVSG